MIYALFFSLPLSPFLTEVSPFSKDSVPEFIEVYWPATKDTPSLSLKWKESICLLTAPEDRPKLIAYSRKPTSDFITIDCLPTLTDSKGTLETNHQSISWHSKTKMNKKHSFKPLLGIWSLKSPNALENAQEVSFSYLREKESLFLLLPPSWKTTKVQLTIQEMPNHKEVYLLINHQEKIQLPIREGLTYQLHFYSEQEIVHEEVILP